MEISNMIRIIASSVSFDVVIELTLASEGRNAGNFTAAGRRDA